MSGVELAAVAVCALPLFAAVANGLNALTGDRLYGQITVGRIAVTTVFASFAASLYIAVAMVTRPGTREVTIYRFMDSGDLSVEFGFLLDPLSVVMMLVVTGISALVTHFSVKYMHNEDGFTRYFTVVSLFVFAMLILVMADNYLIMFLGWEGVGVCSYLLIGFYRGRAASAQAATKAFVMNRVGDAGLLIAMFVLVAQTGTLQYAEVFAQASSLSPGAVEAVGLLLLLGATGKSAQLPLGTWLARAMEGPTPSSALMHAATMVTAGVYLVVRSAPIYDQALIALIAVGIVGAVTALYGQLVGYVQTDIKGLLASSTTAQLGLMFLFCGLGLYAVAIFHLVAHAFYKSYLFLTAPSILHHLHGGADPVAVSRPADSARRSGAAALAVAAGLLAMPLIGRVFEPAGGIAGEVWIVLGLAVIALFAAGFSTRRMTAIAFAGHTDHGGEEGHDTDASPHRADRASRIPTTRLVVPLGVLAGLVALGWAIGILPGGLDGSWFQRLLGQDATEDAGQPLGNPILATLFIVSIALLLLSGWYGPRYLDRFRDELPDAAAPAAARRLYWWALNRGYLDESYDRAIVAPTTSLGRALERFDSVVLDRQTAPSASATRPGLSEPATWEARFLMLGTADPPGATALAEPPQRLDWLVSAGPVAAPDSGHEQPLGVRPRMGAAARRASAWSQGGPDGGGSFTALGNASARLAEKIERVIFQRAEGRGVFGALGNASARIAEGAERVIFQRVDTSTLKLAGVIAGFTDAVERVIFQSGVERGVARTVGGAQRRLLALEQRLGQPSVIGTILGLAVLALIVGTR
ncbi:MAG: NADH-quinone oxidoreductase subunit L [Pseudonocardiales bacterium]|nr:NADH-quinone oxidoreductase subunit L [Pseudonocardiales bacterium]